MVRPNVWNAHRWAGALFLLGFVLVLAGATLYGDRQFHGPVAMDD